MEEWGEEGGKEGGEGQVRVESVVVVEVEVEVEVGGGGVENWNVLVLNSRSKISGYK